MRRGGVAGGGVFVGHHSSCASATAASTPVTGLPLLRFCDGVEPLHLLLDLSGGQLARLSMSSDIDPARIPECNDLGRFGSFRRDSGRA